MKNTKDTPEAYYKLISAQFLQAGNPEIAQQQMAYMKNHFDFYGMKAPVWMGIT